ncbi:hypothetical protein AB1K42_06765 [Roseibium algicola]|uniref:hypothetical protein n=1 Tax=Roseibium algicola TaxID=2857014 RepID=UPI003457FD63
MKVLRSPLLLVLSLATIVWVGVSVWLLLRPMTCVDHTTLVPSFDCLELNELGDFLAGAFAPLAFIWLAAAVFIQANELAAQRRELSMTREELKLGRAVAVRQTKAANAQASEAKRSADHFELQTKILEDEQRTRHEREANSLLDTLRERELNIGRINSKIEIINTSDQTIVKHIRINYPAHVNQIRDYTVIIKEWIEEITPDQKTNITNRIIDKITSNVSLLNEITSLTPRLSKTDQIRLQEWDYARKAEAWEECLSALEQLRNIKESVSSSANDPR